MVPGCCPPHEPATAHPARAGDTLKEFTPEQKQLIIQAVQKKAPTLGHCSLCGSPEWMVGDGFVFMVLQDDLGHLQLTAPGYALCPMICANCGNTHLLNAAVLGLDLDVLKAAAGPTSTSGE